jgi:hypothetical protein
LKCGNAIHKKLNPRLKEKKQDLHENNLFRQCEISRRTTLKKNYESRDLFDIINPLQLT